MRPFLNAYIKLSLIAKPLGEIHDPVFSPYIVHVTGEAPSKDLHSSFIQEYADATRSTACTIYYVQILILLSLRSFDILHMYIQNMGSI